MFSMFRLGVYKTASLNQLVYHAFLAVFKEVIGTINICHLFLYQGREVIPEIQAGSQLAVAWHEECRRVWEASSAHQLEFITAVEQWSTIK